MLGNYAIYFIPRLIDFNQKLKDKGHSLYVIQESDKNKLYDKIPEVDTSGLNMYHLSELTKGVTSYKDKIYSALDKLNPDVLVTGFLAFPYGALGLRWAKSRNKGIIEYDDQRIDTFPRGRFSSWIKSRIIRNVDCFFCPAPAWDDTLLSWGFKKKEIFYGLDTSDNDFWERETKSGDFPQLHKPYFLTVGRQTRMKNLPFFLNAYLKYLDRGGKIPLVMVGEGPEHAKLEQISNKNPMISFLPFQDREHLIELYSKMKALVLPSFKAETWGMVVNECMASGNIVAISNECGSATTLVLDGQNGYHFSPYSQNEIVEALFKIEHLTLEKEQEMRSISKSIIKDWGVERFSDGLYKACTYAFSHKKKVYNPIDFILMKLWKGRFNIKETTK